jgi:hypothetical protein
LRGRAIHQLRSARARKRNPAIFDKRECDDPQHPVVREAGIAVTLISSNLGKIALGKIGGAV